MCVCVCVCVCVCALMVSQWNIADGKTVNSSPRCRKLGLANVLRLKASVGKNTAVYAFSGGRNSILFISTFQVNSSLFFFLPSQWSTFSAVGYCGSQKLSLFCRQLGVIKGSVF